MPEKFDINNIELTNFKKSPTALKSYLEGRDLIRMSGIINLLRIFARPYVWDGGANTNVSVYAAAHAQGYAQALDDLMYFEELFINPQIVPKQPEADFGGLALAVTKGLMTKEEAEKHKHGRRS